LKFSGPSLTVENLLSRDDNQDVPPFFFTHEINVEYVPGKKDISLKIEHIFHTENAESGKKIIESFVAPEVVLSGGTLILKNPQKLDFTSPVPYSFPARHITLFVPTGMKVIGDVFSTPDTDSLIDMRDEIQDQIDALRDQIDQLESTREDITGSVSDEIGSLRREIERLKKESDTLLSPKKAE
jgi:hypothetical protein